MAQRKCRNEIHAQEQELRKATDEKLDDARMKAEQTEALRNLLETLEDPLLEETAEGLNRVVDDAAREAQEQADVSARRVEQSVEAERREVSEPADEAAAKERFAAGRLEAGKVELELFTSQLEEAMDQRDEAARFLDEIREASTDHQDSSTRTAEDISRSAKSAASALRKF